MKKVLLFALSISILVVAVGCNNGPSPAAEKETVDKFENMNKNAAEGEVSR